MRARFVLSTPMLVGLWLAAWGSPGQAQPDALGRVIAAGPGPTGPTLLVSGGYGYTESVLGEGDAHHRIAGSLTLDERALPWLDLALRLDGRYDVHLIPGQATDIGMVGDPRLFARVDHGWSNGLRLGARAGLWLPGADAPSLEAGALSPELLGMVSYGPRAAPIAVTANVGYRLDRSGRSATDPATFRPGDRLALEVSDFNEVLAGLSVTVGRGRGQGFVEASADLLVGTGAPPLKTSPMFVGGGARFAVTTALRLEAEVEVSPSSRPDVSPSAPLVPIPPRVAGWLGLAYRFGASPNAPPVPPPPPPPPVPAPAPPETPAAETTTPPRLPGGQIRGLVRSLRGIGLSADVAVQPENAPTGEGAPAEIKHIRAESGRFQVDVPPGRYRVTIEAPGYTTQVRKVDVEDNGVIFLNLDLRAQP
jgi:hypothetical protein